MKTTTFLLACLAGALLPFCAIEAKPTSGQGGPGSKQRCGGSGAMIKKMDSNQDGELSRSEAEAAAIERVNKMFERLDADGDGIITKEEAKTAREKRKEGGNQI